MSGNNLESLEDLAVFLAEKTSRVLVVRDEDDPEWFIATCGLANILTYNGNPLFEIESTGKTPMHALTGCMLAYLEITGVKA